MKKNRINVLGLGYIGLPTALMLASCGENVIGTDLNDELVNNLQQGEVIFEEEGLSTLLHDAASSGIQSTTLYQTAEIYIVAVPTPYDIYSKKVDPHFVIHAVGQILKVCPKGAVIVIESTIPPGTIDRHIRPMITDKGFIIGRDIHLIHAPERIIPGNMLYELIHNNRTIGADSREIGEQIRHIYESFCKGEIEVTDIRTAEMTKVVENTFRDVNIAFANELARICRRDNLDVYEIIRIANKHPRVNILTPGPGVGGHCISVDPWFLVGDYPDLATIIRKAREINDSMPEYVLSRIFDIMNEKKISDTGKVGIYGLTYKENVDDIRESPTLQLIRSMSKHLGGENIRYYDPFVKSDIVTNQIHNIDDFVSSSDIVVIMVAHNEIIRKQYLLKDKIVLDTRNVCTVGEVYRL